MNSYSKLLENQEAIAKKETVTHHEEPQQDHSSYPDGDQIWQRKLADVRLRNAVGAMVLNRLVVAKHAHEKALSEKYVSDFDKEIACTKSAGEFNEAWLAAVKWAYS
jgi:hypothetical protein